MITVCFPDDEPNVEREGGKIEGGADSFLGVVTKPDSRCNGSCFVGLLKNSEGVGPYHSELNVSRGEQKTTLFRSQNARLPDLRGVSRYFTRSIQVTFAHASLN
eukprot:scaffold2708_cov119-Cylindrotheca_fusiformis.AAC.4